MEISRALPVKKYVAAAAHAQTPEFQQKCDAAIAAVRSWLKNPGINKKIPPALWFGYGKDSMATAIRP